jgi:peptide/nickel transport system permease protein
VLIGVSIIVFSMMKITGDPLDRLRHDPKVTKATIKKLEHNLGLDKPAYTQYLNWSVKFAKGDWGESFTAHGPVSELIANRLPNTLLLMVTSFIISAIAAILIGIYSALKQYSIFDYAATTFSFFGFSMPIFWFGLILQLVFGLYLFKATGYQIFYTAGISSAGMESSIINKAQHLILPVVTLSLAQIAQWSRYQRASMLEVLGADYLKTARAKGLSESQVIFKHALKNALIPVVTVMAIDLAYLFSGAVITETIFAWPGMGSLFYHSIAQHDYPVVMAIIMTSALLVIIFNLVSDVLNGYLDPRIKYD